MPQSNYKHYTLLSTDNSTISTPVLASETQSSHQPKLSTSLLLSLFLNAILLSYVAVNWKSVEFCHLTKIAQLSPEQGLYFTKTNFSHENLEIADSNWHALNTNPGVVTLPDKYIEEHGILKGSRFPWDVNQGVYVIKGYHDLHCLKAIRIAVREYQNKDNQTQAEGHVLHCLDALRQSVMCTASDDLVPVVEGVVELGRGMQCHKWEELSHWALDPQRNGCYNYIDEFRHAKHEIERFGFCPQDSAYYPVMMEYFTNNGHKDPWI